MSGLKRAFDIMQAVAKNETKTKERNAEKTRAHILETAFGEIYRYGFQGVSIDKIIKKTEVTKGAFFHYFPTKNDLGYALVDETIKEMILTRWIRPLEKYKNPVQGILKTYKKLNVDWSNDELVFGCPLNNLTQEMSAVDEVFREKLQKVLLIWINETEKYLKKAQEAGFLIKNVDSRRLAEFIVAHQEASFAMAKTMRDPRMLLSLYNSLKEYLESKT
jgi:TetR/AcrR family transcriptional repressor of nem operon